MGFVQINRSMAWKCSALAIFLTMGVVAQFLPGSGVHARFNATEGVESASFQASRQFRHEQLTARQLAAVKWAIRRLPGNEMKARYGDFPRIRNVVLGEIMRAADKQLETARPIAARIAKLDPGIVATVVQKYKTDLDERRKRLNGNKAYWPVISGVKREPTPSGNMLVRYKLAPPEGMNIKFLPCALEYGDKFEPKRGKLEFDCLFSPNRNGEYLVRLPDPTGLDVSEVALKISIDYSRALVDDGSGKYTEIDAINAENPDIANLQEIYSRMRDTLGDKAFF